MGRSLVRSAASHGDIVTSVGWTQEDNLKEMESWQEGKSIGMLCDIRVRETVENVINKSIQHWGHVDIIAK